MAYNFIQNFTTVNFSKGNSGRKWIVIHYTGGKNDTAMANSNYFKNTNRGASAHYFVDEITVVQVVKDENTAWAVGRNYGSNNLFGKCTNNNSISIEMCSTGGKIADATYRNTVELTKSLMKNMKLMQTMLFVIGMYVLNVAQDGTDGEQTDATLLFGISLKKI